MPDAVGIVGCDGEGVLLRAQLASEAKGDPQRFAGGAGAEPESFELGVGAVDVQSYAGADHDSDHRVLYGRDEAHRDADDCQFAAAPDHGGLPGFAYGFDAENFGPAVAAPPAGAQRDRDSGAPGAHPGRDVAAIGVKGGGRIALGRQAALVQPPDLIGKPQQQIFLMGDQQYRGTGLPEPVKADGDPFPDQRVVRAQGVDQKQRIHRGEVQGIARTQDPHRSRGFNDALFRQRLAGRQVDESALTRAIFTDDAYNRAGRGGGGEILKGWKNNLSVFDRHAKDRIAEMAESDVLGQMRADWNRRAEEDAHYYVAFGGRAQDEAAFQATAADVVRALEGDLKRLPAGNPQSRRALEIGCGPGRLMRPMSRHFGEIHGVDVSDQMIGLARERLRDIPHAHVCATSGSDLAPFADASFDFVYSYAVFQHIPSREVVFSYLRECRRVLKPGGLVRCQINGLPPGAGTPNTWEGVRISAGEVARFTREQDFQLLSLEGTGTQYMWTTWRKRPEGWHRSLGPPNAPPARLRAFGNWLTGEPLVPAAGRFAIVSFWLENLPEECDLNHLDARMEGAAATPTYIGPPVWDGLSQLNVALPAEVRTGLVKAEIGWLGQALCAPGWIRVIPPGPPVPRLCAVSDGVNLSAGTRISSRLVKLTLEEVSAPELLSATVDGEKVDRLDYFQVEQVTARYEVNFRLPAQAGAGRHMVGVRMGRRELASVPVEVL